MRMEGKIKRYAVIEKKVGETPLQALEAFRASTSISADIPLTYAGRLDPMAEGKLLILIGEECKRRDHYDGLDKEYEFEVLLGFSSDTGDVLGLAEADDAGILSEYSEKELYKLARSLHGAHELHYPVFSSKTVNGKPLFQYALEGTLGSIEIPTAQTSLYRVEYLGKEIAERGELVERITAKIGLLEAPRDSGRLGADFRKDEILARWEALEEPTRVKHTLLKFRAVVSSGTYIRALAPAIARSLGTRGLAFSIRRTRIGRYQTFSGHLGFWRKVF